MQIRIQMEVSRRTMWISSGLLARLLMMAVLLMSVRFILDNRLIYEDDVDYSGNLGVFKLQSHTYVVASAIVGTAGNLLQIPVAIYLLCKSKKTTPSAMILDTSMHADIAISVVLASGVDAGFGATNDVMRLIRAGKWEFLQQVEQDLLSYYKRTILGVIFLIGMLLSLCVTVVSARLRARAINDSEAV